MPSTPVHPHDCRCDKYACRMRAKSVAVQMETGVKTMNNVKMVSPGQDGPKGRNSESGQLL